MAQLKSPDQLATQLETGVGRADLYLQAIPPELRLRLPICGLVSYALANTLSDAGYTIEVIESRPRFPFRPSFKHIFPVVYGKKETTVVDATYSSTLTLAGVSAEGVYLGDKNMFPEKKVVTFPKDGHDFIAGALADKAVQCLQTWTPFDRPDVRIPRRAPDLIGFTPQEIEDDFYAIWDSENWYYYEPKKETIEDARKLAQFITLDSVQLID